MEAKKRSSTVAGLQRAARITFARYPLSYRSRLLSLRTEIAAGLSRYTNRLEIESGLSVPLSGSSTRDDHRKLIAEANRRFQAGSYDTSIDALSQASACASVASKRLGLDWLGLSLCDSEIVGYIGHTALGLSVRAKAGVLGLTAPKRKVVVASRVANPSYLEYWRKYFEIHVVSGQQERAVCGRLWPLVEDILYFNGVGELVPLYTAASETERGWEEQGLPPLLSLTSQDREQSLSFLKKYGFGERDWFVALHVRDRPDNAPGYGRNSRIHDYTQANSAVTDLAGGLSGWAPRRWHRCLNKNA